MDGAGIHGSRRRGRSPLKDVHAALDAYVFTSGGGLLQQLLDLNHAVAARERDGHPVVAPGVPPRYITDGGDPAALVTADCIRPLQPRVNDPGCRGGQLTTDATPCLDGGWAAVVTRRPNPPGH